MDTEIINQVLGIILPAIGSLVATIIGIVAAQIKKMYEEKLNTETKRQVADMTVKFVEQVYKELHGEEKLNAALNRAGEILNEKGINFSIAEIRTMIEASVYDNINWYDEQLRENNEEKEAE